MMDLIKSIKTGLSVNEKERHFLQSKVTNVKFNDLDSNVILKGCIIRESTYLSMCEIYIRPLLICTFRKLLA